MISNLLSSSRPFFVGLRSQALPRTPGDTCRRSYRAAADTIYSVSSGQVTKAGVCVLRTSGPAVKHCLQAFLREAGPLTLNPRQAHLKKLYCPKTGLILDKALVLWFPGPHSFTGEDVAELHLHGSIAVVSGVLSAFEHMNSQSSHCVGRIRPAEAGEYTRRAFQNGKMDLTEVEGLADLLEAQTGVQRVQALNQMEGHLKIKFEGWRAEIVHCLAHMEAVIDFGDDDRESDISEAAASPLYPRMNRLMQQLMTHLDDGRRGEIIREGFRIVLVGPPNAGKSSILNVMARRPAAIVSPEPGTTRDIIEVRLSVGGVCCMITDTAGIRTNIEAVASGQIGGLNAVEEEGIRRARAALASADLKVFVCDSSDAKSVLALSNMLLSDGSSNGNNSRTVILCNKIDIVRPVHEMDKLGVQYDVHGISCATGEGIKDFEAAVERYVHAMLSPSGNTSLVDTDQDSIRSGQEYKADVLTDRLSGITRQRHRFHIEQCVGHLSRFLGSADGEDDGAMLLDVKAEELRLASQELARVTGHVDIEELLDIIFRDFCIGK